MLGTRVAQSAVAIGLGLCFTGLATAGDDEAKTLSIGDAAPPIDIAHWVKGVETKKNGQEFEPMTSFEEGKVYVLEFWATWCGPCVGSMPHLSKLQEKYKDYDVTVIGVSDAPFPTVIDFLFKKYKKDDKLHNDRTQYTLATDPDESVKNDYFRAAGQRGIPCSFIIGKDSKVEWIGHPMEMDGPLESVVFGSWDRDKFKASREKKRKAEKAFQTATRNQDWDALLELMDEQIADDPENLELLYQKFMLLLVQMDRPKEAYGFGGKVLEANWDNAGVLNMIAWTVVDDRNVKVRDLAFALNAAKRANELTESVDPAIIDTLARVYYEKGDLKKAIKWQTKAVEHAGEGRLGDDLRKALEKYKAAVK